MGHGCQYPNCLADAALVHTECPKFTVCLQYNYI